MWDTCKSNHSSNSCVVEGNRLVFHGKPEEVEEKDPTVFSKPRNLNNMTKLSSKKRERHVVQLLTTKSLAKYVDEPGSGEQIKLNPIMKDLIINGYENKHYTQAGERKRKK
jgi:hypothetical protein